MKKLYEGLFLVDSGLAASDWDGVNNEIKRILERVGADVVSMKKWDERKLAYQIARKTRGTYILCYFQVEGPRIAEIERQIQLSETIMRALILGTEKMSQEDIEKDTPAMIAERSPAPAAQDAADESETDNETDTEVEDNDNDSDDQGESQDDQAAEEDSSDESDDDENSSDEPDKEATS